MPETIELSDIKRSLLKKYLRGQVEVRSVSQAIPRRASEMPMHLSYAQEQVWLHAQMAPELPLYNEPVTIHHFGPLDIAALERSFNEILRRHEAWRTCFTVIDGEPVQHVQPSLKISLPVVDLRGLSKDEREAEASRIATEDAKRPLDLAQVPLFRTRLIRLGNEEYRLYLTLSHIIFDGVAIYRVFLPELSALYKAFTSGRPSPLPELQVQYTDYSAWQRQHRGPEALSEHIAYWRKQLRHELVPVKLPADRPCPALQTFRGSMYPFALNSNLTAAVKRVSQREGITLFQTLLASFAALLHRYSAEDDIPIGSVTTGRDYSESQVLLGYFLNTVVLRADLSGNPGFRELMARMRNLTLEALEHDCVPFGHLIQELAPARDLSRNPLFQVMFSLEPPMPEVDPAWRLTQMDVDTGATKYDLYLELDERREGVLARFHYSTDLFDLETIKRMAGHWLTLIEGAANNPSLRVSELPILSEGERRQYEEWNGGRSEYPQDRCIHELFAEQAERQPDAVAVVFEHLQLTYRELNERANQLAWRLRKLGVGPDVPVGLYVERSLEMVVGLLGILKAGGAYIPLDPAFPEERLAFMLADARPAALLTQQRLERRLPWAGNVVRLDADWSVIAEESKSNPPTEQKPESLAYVIYTSGSTGQPKGVQVEHRNVVNLLCSMRREPGMSRDDVLVAVTTLSFDIAGLEIYLPLISGARLVVAGSETARDGKLLLSLMGRSGATVMQATPSTWQLLIEAGWQGLPPLKVLCGGEALPPELGRELTNRSASVWNVYGPTETTIWSAVYRLQGREAGSIPIGRPIANTQIYVLDAHRNLLPVNVAGEIYIGGDGVARGYLNRPELTAEKFIPDPFGGRRARLYRTGDQGRYLPDGTVECLGRLDHQVKIRGFRIELGEIEAVLGCHQAVRRCVVVAREDEPGDKRLVAYLEVQEGAEAGAGDLRAHLKKQLPEYMLPSLFMTLEKLPLTPNGKIDRKALPPPDVGRPEMDRRLVAPRDEVEQILTLLWSKVLKIRQVGLHDDFFELGGHSLLAVRIISEIEKLFKRRLPLATLLQAPTIGRLAQVLREEHLKPSWSSLVPLRPGGRKTPLFLMHAHGGNVLEYHSLSNRLPSDQPVYALQARGLDGRIVRNQTLEEMAAAYIVELRSLQPQGPYILGGFCFGGLLALEAAQQLSAAGEAVSLLVLIQTMNPVYARFNPGTNIFRQWWYRAKKRIDLERENLSHRGLGYIGERSRYVGNVLCARAAIALNRAIGNGQRQRSDLSTQYVLESLSIEHNKALRKYKPRSYRGKVVLFRASKQLSGLMTDYLLGWKDLLREDLDICEVPGHQQNMMLEPNVSHLVQPLTTRLAAAQQRETSMIGEPLGV